MIPSGTIGAVTWRVTKPAGMKGVLTVEFERATSEKVDGEVLGFMRKLAIARHGKGARTYSLDRVLMIKKVAVGGWREEIEKLARRFERT